jgi:hypothetical protein
MLRNNSNKISHLQSVLETYIRVTLFETIKLAHGLADGKSMKVSKLSPFIVIPSPEGVKEAKPAVKVKATKSMSSGADDESNEAKHEVQKVVALEKYQQHKKNKHNSNSSSKLKGLATYSKVQVGDIEFLLKNNFKKVI